jgi:hypothetical protein
VKNLSAAIYGKIAGSAFSTSVGGRLYKARAPQNPTFPYVVYDIISDVQMDTFTERLEDVLIQFTIFSIASGSTEIEDIYANLKALYDYCSLSITGNTHLSMERQNATLMSGQLDEEMGGGLYYQYNIDYYVLLKKN